MTVGVIAATMTVGVIAAAMAVGAAVGASTVAVGASAPQALTNSIIPVRTARPLYLSFIESLSSSINRN